MPADPPFGPAGIGEPAAAMTRQAEVPSGNLEAPVETPLAAQHGVVVGQQAPDPIETLRASREVPEPDSLGG